MQPLEPHIIYSIGHSTRTLAEFIGMLQSFNIKTLVDIRQYPGSRKYPHFNKENLETEMARRSIKYIHLKELGGRRKVVQNSKNTRWHHASFRGYADYMETTEFKKAIIRLETIALHNSTAYMCSEAVWWRCHRSMVSDFLKVQGWTVLHITATEKAKEHSYTSAARISDNHLFYSDENLFNQQP